MHVFAYKTLEGIKIVKYWDIKNIIELKNVWFLKCINFTYNIQWSGSDHKNTTILAYKNGFFWSCEQ